MTYQYWEVIQAMPAAEMTELMRRFEDLGIYGVWAPQLHWPPFATLAAAAMASTRLKLGTGIALAFSRSPMETALSALDLDRISSGRAVLGLGTSVRLFNERMHGVVYGKPVAHLREVVEIVRIIIERGHQGDLGRIDGAYHKLDLTGFKTGRKPVRNAIPIYLPALFQNTVDSPRRSPTDCSAILSGHSNGLPTKRRHSKRNWLARVARARSSTSIYGTT